MPIEDASPPDTAPSGPLIVVDYDPSWPRVFEELRAWIAPALSDLAITVEHVGSTAVPGLAAKPVIDIDVVATPEAVPDGIECLEGLGYVHRGDLGIPGREAFRAPPRFPRHHLYLCPEGSPALANHLAVRDYLRGHPDEARSYGELKKRLAAQFADDRDGYMEGKADFLLGILEKAGFATDLLDDIAHMNRRR